MRIDARAIRVGTAYSRGLLRLPARVIGLPPGVIVCQSMILAGRRLRAVGARVRVGDSAHRALIGHEVTVLVGRHGGLPARVIDRLPAGVIATLVAMGSRQGISSNRARRAICRSRGTHWRRARWCARWEERGKFDEQRAGGESGDGVQHTCDVPVVFVILVCLLMGVIEV